MANPDHLSSTDVQVIRVKSSSRASDIDSRNSHRDSHEEIGQCLPTKISDSPVLTRSSTVISSLDQDALSASDEGDELKAPSKFHAGDQPMNPLIGVPSASNGCSPISIVNIRIPSPNALQPDSLQGRLVDWDADPLAMGKEPKPEPVLSM